MTQYIDMGDFSEDTRIDQIAHQVRDHKKFVAFMTDDEPGKVERYIQKLRDRVPGIQIIKQMKGPVRGVVTVQVGPPVDA
jgi:hypothetical protein